MPLVQILTPGFVFPNSRALLFPLLIWKKTLARRGIRLRIVDAADRLRTSDVLVVDSKYHRDRWLTDPDDIVADFVRFRDVAGKVIYCDTTDSTGWLQTELLPVVDRYWKFQLLRDRAAYLRPMYGHRVFTDYYHRIHGVCDAEPAWSAAVSDPAFLAKLDVCWNSGMADYSLPGFYRTACSLRLPVPGLVRFPSARAFVSPLTPRSNEVSCRFGVGYSRATVAWQRLTIRARLEHRFSFGRVSRHRYFAELRRSKIALSPFGFGEVCYRDFECFLSGTLLIKPDMQHLETWPDLFDAGETMLAHSWDLSDLEAVIDQALSGYGEMVAMAREGQERYRRHLAGPMAAELFCDHLEQLLARK
ncbi:MAG: glycosyltransferase [Thermodesulfobacteriota bacterium]